MTDWSFAWVGSIIGLKIQKYVEVVYTVEATMAATTMHEGVFMLDASSQARLSAHVVRRQALLSPMHPSRSSHPPHAVLRQA